MAAKSSKGPNRKTKALTQRLESLQLAGVSHIKRGKKVVRSAKKPPVSTPPSKPTQRVPSRIAPPLQTPVRQAKVPSVSSPSLRESPFPGSELSEPKRIEALKILRQEVAGCQLCRGLAATRTQTVFGVGALRPRVCFLGEAPGADEDAQGEPFVGRAGQLLTQIIQACGWQREEVYILNVLKCRPPGNRTPLPDEVSRCRGFFEKQLEILRPEFLCCLGSVAAQSLLETTTPIGRLRGTFHSYRGIQVLCTYHPAYLLRNPPAKKDVWEDMKLLLKKMGLKLPPGQKK